MKDLAIILGIRPDVIRASKILKLLKNQSDIEFDFIWSGQHYSENMKDTFFKQLNVPKPDFEFEINKGSDADIVSSTIKNLFNHFNDHKYKAAVFLGDTNTVMGSIAAAQHNIPIVHIEGCMRSYDWRMPEEKYRGTIDHLSDVIYTYFPEYKEQGIDEGLNPNSIVLVQNLIVDVLNEYYFKKKDFYDKMASNEFFVQRGIERGEFYLMTCHRRENVHIRESFENILKLLRHTKRKIYFTASYRTQKVLTEYGLTVPENVILIDPIGYQEMLVLMTNSRGVITDSGTVVEETCVLQVPSLQIRKATERPQVYDAKSSVKFDPTQPDSYPHELIFQKFENLYGKHWEHNLGDGKASERVVKDLLFRLRNDGFRMHKPEDYHLKIERSYREDGL